MCSTIVYALFYYLSTTVSAISENGYGQESIQKQKTAHYVSCAVHDSGSLDEAAVAAVSSATKADEETGPQLVETTQDISET